MNQRRAGAILSYIALISNAFVAFLFVPILLSSLSTAEFGVFELIGSIIAYLSVMDAGLSTTLSRFYVKANVSESRKSLENLLAIAGVIYCFLTALAVLVCLIVYWALPYLFSDSFTVYELSLAQRMMFLVGINCLIVLPGNWFLAQICANEKFVFAKLVSILKNLLNLAVVYIVLQFSSSAILVLSVQVFVNLVSIGCYAVYCTRNFDIKPHFHNWDWSLIRELFVFSFFILLNVIFDQIFWKTGQIVLGAVSGAVSVAVYGIVCKIITSGYMQVANGVGGVFLPRITELSALETNMKEIDSIFIKIGRIQAMLVWGVCSAFIILGQQFIYLWAGDGFESAYLATVLLMVGLNLALIQSIGVTILQAKNKLGFRSALFIVMAFLDLIISIPMSIKYGVIGCALTAAMLLFVGTGPIMNYYYWKIIKIDIPLFYKNVLPLLMPVIFAGTITYFLNHFFFSGYSWFCFILQATLFCIVYILLLWRFSFNAYEKSLINSVLKKIGVRLERCNS